MLLASLLLSPPQRLKGFFSGREDPLSNVSAGTALPVTAESAYEHFVQRIYIANAFERTPVV